MARDIPQAAWLPDADVYPEAKLYRMKFVGPAGYFGPDKEDKMMTVTQEQLIDIRKHALDRAMSHAGWYTGAPTPTWSEVDTLALAKTLEAFMLRDRE